MIAADISGNQLVELPLFRAAIFASCPDLAIAIDAIPLLD